VIEAQAAWKKRTTPRRRWTPRITLDSARKHREEARAALEKAEIPYDKALRVAFVAERKLDLARIHKAEALGKAPIVVNSFDLVMLQHVGKTAQQYLHGGQVPVVAVDQGRGGNGREGPLSPSNRPRPIKSRRKAIWKRPRATRRPRRRSRRTCGCRSSVKLCGSQHQAGR